MLYLIGMGIQDEKDISLRGLEACKKCSKVYAELYTNPMNIDIKNLEKLVGKKVMVLERKQVEEENMILESAKKEDVAFLVGGDPLIATTHSDIVLRAKKQGIKVKIIHSSSIYSAVAETGLMIYKFGRTVSIPFSQKNYAPKSPYEKIKLNLKDGLHTLVLLDIGMKANQGLELLKNEIDDTNLIVCAHLGENSLIKYGKINELIKQDFGELPHCIIIPGELHFHEKEFLETLRCEK